MSLSNLQNLFTCLKESESDIIYLDMDGVLADFVSALLDAHGSHLTDQEITAWDMRKFIPVDSVAELFAPTENFEFWYGISPYYWARAVLGACASTSKTYICTSPTSYWGCMSAKIKWCRDHLRLPPQSVICISDKSLLAHPKSLLIDDRRSSISSFIEKGGKGFLFEQPWSCNE